MLAALSEWEKLALAAGEENSSTDEDRCCEATEKENRMTVRYLYGGRRGSGCVEALNAALSLERARRWNHHKDCEHKQEM